MPASPTAPDPHIQRLVEEGHEVTIDGGYLIVDRIPYVTSAREIAWGALICPYRNVDGVPQLDNDHQCWFTGAMPHCAHGTSLEFPLNSRKEAQTVAGRPVQMRFSNKPEPIGDFFDNHYNKVTHYIRKLSRHARDIDPAVSATSVGSYRRREVPSVFHYANDAIALGGLDEIADKLRLRRFRSDDSLCHFGALHDERRTSRRKSPGGRALRRGCGGTRPVAQPLRLSATNCRDGTAENRDKSAFSRR